MTEISDDPRPGPRPRHRHRQPEAEAMTRDIARAMAAIDALYNGDDVMHDAIARAAIAALLPPSDAMVEAAARTICFRWTGAYGGWDAYRDATEGALTAAINAALGVKP